MLKTVHQRKSPELGKVERVPLREAWSHEAYDFTPWMAQNLKLLGESIGMELELEATEKAVGPYGADLLAKEVATGQWVLVENQLETTDHTHLGQVFTYAAGLKATTIIWVAGRFTDEHRAVIDWLNEITDTDHTFFGLEVELWRIGDSLMAPVFNVICKPNGWAKSVYRPVKQIQAGVVGSTVIQFIESELSKGHTPPLSDIMNATGCSKGSASRYRNYVLSQQQYIREEDRHTKERTRVSVTYS